MVCYLLTQKSNIDRQGRPVALYKRAVLGGEHIINSSSGLDQNTSTPQVSVTLDSEGGEIMSQTTKKYYKKPMATLYVEYKDNGKKDENGKTILEKSEEVINVATIQGRFSSNFQITGVSSSAEAQNLSMLFKIRCIKSRQCKLLKSVQLVLHWVHKT